MSTDLPVFEDRGLGYKTRLTSNETPLHKALAKAAPQSAIVIEYLASGRGLSVLIAHTVLGVTSLTTRIAELRKLGIPITGKWHRDHSKKRFMVYRYEPGVVSYDEPEPEDDHSRWEDDGGPAHPKADRPTRTERTAG